jgi:bifunctional isochorismate lyase/aryl carrier protein
MSLPAQIDYDAPLADLPVSRAPWTLDPCRAAVLVHDLQHYFLRPYHPASPALTGMLAATARVLSAARSAGVPVFYTAQDGDHSDRGLQRDLWGPGMPAEPANTGIDPRVAPLDGDVVLAKRRYSAFAKSDLADRLAAAGRDQLVIAGVYAGIGVTATAYDAFQREVRPFVVADAVADLGRDQHARALAQVASCCGVVLTTDRVVEALTAGAVGGWAQEVRRALAGVVSADVVDRAVADPEADLFQLGLNSLQAFEMLDVLADAGVDIDYGEFSRRATLAFLRDQGALVAAP